MNISPSNNKNSYHLAYLLVVMIFAGLMALQKIYDYDLWWHLRSGQWIVEQGAFPSVDPFSFSTSGADWVYVYGLADPIFYLLQKWLGINGLQIFTAGIIVGSVGALYLFLTRNRHWCPAAAALLTICVVQVARFRFMVRPLVFKFAGIVFLFWFFYRKGALRWRYPLFFLAVVLWNWFYPAAFLAQLFALFLLLEKLVERLCRSGRYVAGDLRDALILVALASLALLVNPNGAGLYKMLYGSFFVDYATSTFVVEEHQPLIWNQRPLFALLIGLAAASFFVGRRNFRILTLLIFAVFVFLAWGSVRYVGIAAFAVAGVIAVNLSEWSAPNWVEGWFSGKKWPALLVMGALTAGCIFLWQATFQKTRGYEFGLGIKTNRYPYAAVQLLKDVGFSGNIYNSWKFGGFLQWHLPTAKTFIDGRCLPAQLALYDRFKSIERHAFSRYLTEKQVQAALLDRQDLRDIDYFANMPGFRQVFADDLSVLFIRNDLILAQGQNSTGGYKYLRQGGYEFEYLAPLAVGPDAPLVEGELLKATKEAPDSFFENFLLAYFYEARGDSRAAAQYLLAARKNPGFSVTHFNIGSRGGQAALKARQWELAVEIVSLALDYQKTGELYFLLGTAQHQLKQREAAEKAYHVSLDLAENGRVRNNLGFLLLEMDRPEAARETFAKGFDGRTGTDREQSLYGLVLALGKLQRMKEAAEMRGRLMREFPQSQYLQKLP